MGLKVPHKSLLRSYMGSAPCALPTQCLALPKWRDTLKGQLDVHAETAAFLNATEPHPLWEGPAPLCLVEHYAGQVRRLRLVLTKQSCLSQGEQNQFLTHAHPLQGSGLLFGYAADGCANPDWLIVSDTSYSGTWRLLHAVSNAGGSRFTVGSAVRYPPGRSYAANKARLYQFEALHKIYFYDAWRSEPILNRDNSPLLLPPAPGMLQDGCYWTTAAAVVDTQSPDASMPANRLPPDDPDLISSDEQPSLLPSPDSICSLPNSQAPPASGSNQACEEAPLKPQSQPHRQQARSPPQVERRGRRCVKSVAVTHPSLFTRVAKIGKKKLQLMTQWLNNKRKKRQPAYGR